MDDLLPPLAQNLPKSKYITFWKPLDMMQGYRVNKRAWR